MNLDYWLAEFPSDYILIVSILTEFLLAIIFYNLVLTQRSNAMSRLKDAMPEMLGPKQTEGIAIMRNTSAVMFAGGLIVFVGWVVSFGVFLSFVPDTVEEEFTFLTGATLLAFLAGVFVIQILFWLPMASALGTYYVVTPRGILRARRRSREQLIPWSEVTSIRWTSSGSLYGYSIHTEHGRIRMRCDMTGFTEFAKIAVDKVPRERRPLGTYALERFIHAPPGKIWYVAPWNTSGKWG